MAADAEFEQRFARVEGLLAELAHSTDPTLERAIREILATVLELHRRGLERMLEIAASDASVREALAADARVSAMLLLHGLHPTALSERISRALSGFLERHRSKVEGVDFDERGAEIHVRVVPASSACQSTRGALKKDLEDALIAVAPDVQTLFVEINDPAPALITLRTKPVAVGAQPAGGGE
jgi:Fe-S cluster biogenesis protein NfuA